MPDTPEQHEHSPWPRRWAWLLACATFPLVWVGGLVTTTDAGMAVPDWPSTYGYNLFLYPWQTWLAGPWDLFIEHGHRLLAATVGLLTIALLVCLWRHDSRRWIRCLGGAALLLVIAQGVLGGLRVIFDERLLAMVHGVTGPAFFGLTAALVVVTSRTWAAGPRSSPRQAPYPQAANLRALAVLTAVCVLAQIALGAVLRHVPVGASPSTFAAGVQFHLFLAGVLTLQIVLLAWLVRSVARTQPVLRHLSRAFVVLIVLQLSLGVATWAAKYSAPRWVGETAWLAGYTIRAGSWLQTHIVTAHVAVGSLMLAAAVALALLVLRLVPAPRSRGAGVTRLMEVAA